MTYDPADPHDPRHDLHAAEPILETFRIAVEGSRPFEHAHRIEHLLNGEPGVEALHIEAKAAFVEITYDARRTNPAAIHEILLDRGYKPAEATE